MLASVRSRRTSTAASTIAAMLCFASDPCAPAPRRLVNNVAALLNLDIRVRDKLLLTPVYELRRVAVALAIEAEGLRKRFGPTRALAGLNLTVARQGVRAARANGAGKTTRSASSPRLLRPDAGALAVFGHEWCGRGRGPPADRTGGQAATVDADLTGRENLVFLGLLGGLRGWRAGGGRRSAGGFVGREQCRHPGQGVLRWHAPPAGPGRQFSSGPTCISWTSRPPGWIPRPRPGLGPIAAGRGSGRPYCSPPSTWRRPTGSPERVAVIGRGRVVAEGTPAELKAGRGKVERSTRCSSRSPPLLNRG